MRYWLNIATAVIVGFVPVACSDDEGDTSSTTTASQETTTEVIEQPSTTEETDVAESPETTPAIETTEPPPTTAGPSETTEPPPTTAGPSETTEPPPTTAEPSETTTPALEPLDFSARGPHAVGHTTLTLGDRMVEVFYPADPASVDSAAAYTGYSTEIAFPEAIRPVVPAPMAVPVELDAVFQEPAVSPDGPFPIVIRSHGDIDSPLYHSVMSSHLASWGFVVALPEHTERGFGDYFLPGSVPDREGYDTQDVLQTLDLLATSNDDEASVLHGGIDADTVALTGYSQGGRTVVRPDLAVLATAIVLYAPTPFDDDLDENVVRALTEPEQLPLIAEHLARFDAPAVPTLMIRGDEDVLIPAAWARAIEEWLGDVATSVEIAGGGHGFVRDICLPIQEMGGMVPFTDELAPLTAEEVVLLENGCSPSSIDAALGYDIANHLTAAFLTDALGLAEAEPSLEPEQLTELFGDSVAYVG